MGEFRAHYAGFFDPGFGYGAGGLPGTRAILEVRSHDVPYLLRDGQSIARLMYEGLTDVPTRLYGQDLPSSYQDQHLGLAKQFRRTRAHKA
jgi:dCTP deaminase